MTLLLRLDLLLLLEKDTSEKGDMLLNIRRDSSSRRLSSFANSTKRKELILT